MSPTQCSREHDVVAAILGNQWPDRCDESLYAHATHCEVCSELVELVDLMRLERDALKDVSVPAAGQVWWRAAIRARIEVSQQVVRPLGWVFGVASACVVGLGLAGIELLWSPIQRSLLWGQGAAWIDPGWVPSFRLSDVLGALPRLGDLTPLAQTSAFLLLGLVACLLLAPLALYFALSDE